MHTFGGLEEVTATLDALAARGLAERVGRRPGQKEERYRQLLGAEGEEVIEEVIEDAPPPVAAAASEPPPPPVAPLRPPAPVPDERVERLEREVAALRADLDALRAELGVS
jgi:uncharacterized protein YceH (UPF0502 family)